MVKILMYRTAVHPYDDMRSFTSALSPIEFSSEVSKISILFFRS